MTSARNIVAATNPLYILQGYKYIADDGTEKTFDFGESDSSGNGHADDWRIMLQVAPTGGLVTMYAYQRKKFDLTGLYNQEKMIIPLGNNIQTSEPPLLGADNPKDCFLREFEIWSTVELTSREIETRLLNPFIPTLPGFPASPQGPDAYLDPSNVIAGRARLFVGTSVFGTGYGFMSKLHESIIGEGEPAAAPDLHYVRGFYMQTIKPGSLTGWVFCDLPGARDILTVGVTETKDAVHWLNQIDRGAYNDSRP